MVRVGVVAYILALFFLLFSAVLWIPLVLAMLAEADDPRPSLHAFLITFTTGALLYTVARHRLDGLGQSGDLSLREGLLLVVLVWAMAALFGSLPFQFSPFFPSFTDALFESTSGFTTTGASVLPDVEVLTPSLQFWRHFTHWLGGMGIVMLMIAILPLIGPGSAHLYRAHFAGAKSDKLRPRVIETAQSLWKIYFALTLAEYLALRWAGMSPFDAVCHSFSTMATGGFSTRSASVGGFGSPTVEFIIIVFMVLASINFSMHYRLWVERRPHEFISDLEVRGHLFTIATAWLIVSASVVWQSGYPVSTALRHALFQVTSIGTCTGFATYDYERWRPLPQVLLLVLMYIGGNTGSTAGGLKTFRILLLTRVIGRQFKRLVNRRGVFAIRVGDQVLPEKTVESVLTLVYLALLFNFVSALLMTAFGVDLVTSISAVASAMFGIGPGLGTVGPAEHYGHLPAPAKWVLIGSMLAGRLEFYTALVVFTPFFWRK